MYIVIEGQDGTGKSTQVERLAERLRNSGKEVLTFHEPDGELEAAHAMRAIIKDKRYNLEPMTHVMLFTAARYELWQKLAEPVLRRGGYVISARNWWSTLAYQGYGQGVSRVRIVRVTKEVMPAGYVKPDQAVILTLDDQIRKARQGGRDEARQRREGRQDETQREEAVRLEGASRLEDASQVADVARSEGASRGVEVYGADTTTETDTFESKPDEFQQKVNHAYEKIAKEFEIPTLNASGTVEEVGVSIDKMLKV